MIRNPKFGALLADKAFDVQWLIELLQAQFDASCGFVKAMDGTLCTQASPCRPAFQNLFKVCPWAQKVRIWARP